MRLRAIVLLAVTCLMGLVVAVQPASGQDQPVWLTTLNAYRSVGALPLLHDMPEHTGGERAHATYMLNHLQASYEEEELDPYYSREGDEAARNGEVAYWRGSDLTDRRVLESWLAAPFHQLPILDPRLSGTAYGTDRQSAPAPSGAATLDVKRGRRAASGLRFPYAWPGDGSVVPLREMGSDDLNALGSCPGFTGRAGLPLVAFFAGEADVTDSSLKDAGGQELDHCVLSATTFANGNADQTTKARAALSGAHAVVVIPRVPLRDGERYTLRVDTSAGVATSSFRTGAQIQAATGAPTPVPATASPKPSATATPPRSTPMQDATTTPIPTLRVPSATPAQTRAPARAASTATKRPSTPAPAPAAAAEVPTAAPAREGSPIEIMLTPPSPHAFRTVPLTPPQRGVDGTGWIATGFAVTAWSTLYLARRRRRGSSLVASLLWLKSRLGR